MALTRVTYYVDDHDRIYNAPTTLTFVTRDEAVQWAIDNDLFFNIVSVIEEGVGTIAPPWSSPQSYVDADSVFFPSDVVIGGDILGGNVPTLVAADPAEVDLDPDPTGEIVTLTLSDEIARNAFSHGSGQYYHSIYGTSSTSTLTQDQLVLSPVWLSEGDIDRIGVEVTTGQVSGTIRVGIFTDSGGLPSALIAESTAPADASANGVKDQTIAANIPVNGRYWLAAVAQGAAGIVIQGGAAVPTIPIPLGTAAVGGTTAFVSRIKPSVSGTLASVSPLTGLNANGQGVRVRWHFRYA